MKKPTALLTALLFAMATSAFAQKAETPKAAPAPAAKAAPAAAPATATAPAAKTEPAKVELVDINSADTKTLMTLKGVGDVTADKIVKGRPYGGKDDLVKKKIITEKVYGDIKELIIAKQAAAPKKDEKKK